MYHKSYNKAFKHLCTPAQIYLVIAVIHAVLLLFRRFPLMYILMGLVFALIWTYILGWLCKKGFTALSWFLVLLPYIVIFIEVLGFISISRYVMGITGPLQMQPALSV